MVKKKDSTKKESFKLSKKIIIITALILVVGISITYRTSVLRAPSDIDGIQCNQMEQAVFHIHAHLDVYVDGQHRTVPAFIGIIPNSCLYWIHTHDPTGIIHIEAPEYKTFTLGQFLDVWSKSFEKTGIPIGTPKSYVNGKEFNGNYREIQLNAHDEIALVYGLPPESIPTSFDFPQGL
jgi:hypothetical protein